MVTYSDRWYVHGERTVYDSDWVRVGLADISQPSGKRFEHHVVWFPAPAMTVLLDDAGENVLMAWRHRFPRTSGTGSCRAESWTRASRPRRRRPVS